MTMQETECLMLSDNHVDRFKAEYWQTKIRYNRLHSMLVKYNANTLQFEPKCPIEILTDQKEYMGKYLDMLEIRAEIEGIKLE